MILGPGNNFYWLGFGAGAGAGSAFCLGAGGRFCSCSPSCSLKVWCFECWSTHVAYAFIPGSYSIGFGFDQPLSCPDSGCFSLHHYFSYHFAFRVLGHYYWHFDCYVSDSSWIPVIGFSFMYFEFL